jgi:hypothetical protein
MLYEPLKVTITLEKTAVAIFLGNPKALENIAVPSSCRVLAY